MLRNPMRLSWILTIITSTLLFSGYSAWAQTPLTDCDRLAANTTDARKHSSAPGVPFKQVRENVNAALSACADAVKSFPNELRFQYQYARALQIRDKKSASQLFVKLSENGYPAAFDNVGWIQISENNDYDAAIRAFRKGYELGDADCAVSLFEMIEREKWKPENEKQIRITLLEKAAAANHAGAVVALPIERAKHGTPPNDSTAAAPKSAAASTTTNDSTAQPQPQAPVRQAQTQAPAPAQAQAWGSPQCTQTYFHDVWLARLDPTRGRLQCPSAPDECKQQCDGYLGFRTDKRKNETRTVLNARWVAYSQREKTLIETVLNYSTTAHEDGEEYQYWVAGYQGDKCVVVWTTMGNDGTIESTVINIKTFNRAGFRYSQSLFGDEKRNVLVRASPPPLMERMGKAWELAFRECPPKSSAF